mmetsp:Transcript_82289/g.246697  ORF Transcript_82289/g.246697 Transcript_82289/m.246697 type:complete len:429 (-) Transcript_82289:25-1311(-)
MIDASNALRVAALVVLLLWLAAGSSLFVTSIFVSVTSQRPRQAPCPGVQAGMPAAGSERRPTHQSASNSSTSPSRCGRADWRCFKRMRAERAQASPEYHPGAVEDEWHVKKKERLRICRKAKLPSQIAGAHTWLAYQRASAGPAPRAPTDDEQHVLSHFSSNRTNCREMIEPLTGIGRHPFATLGCRLGSVIGVGNRTSKFDTSYLIIPNECGASNGSLQRCGRRGLRAADLGRNLLFDLGSYKYYPLREDQIVSGQFTSWEVPTIALFYSLYRRNCITFDRIWAWEAHAFDATNFWQRVPIEILAKLHFYNFPIHEGDPGYLSHRSLLYSSALHVIQEVASPDDFVVVKLDIDSPALEKYIIRSILRRPGLAELIDELFFEYHFKFGKTDIGWGQGHSNGAMNDTVELAIDTMTRLRRRGIRAHFWI